MMTHSEVRQAIAALDQWIASQDIDAKEAVRVLLGCLVRRVIEEHEEQWAADELQAGIDYYRMNHSG